MGNRLGVLDLIYLGVCYLFCHLVESAAPALFPWLPEQEGDNEKPEWIWKTWALGVHSQMGGAGQRLHSDFKSLVPHTGHSSFLWWDL